MTRSIDVTIIGGGMITHDLILPAVYHLQRTGVVGGISVCALNSAPLKELRESPELRQAFPGQDFTAFPPVEEPPEKKFPFRYREVLDRMKPRQAVVVAVPDQMHFSVVTEILERDQNVLCVKPLALKYGHAREIEKLVREKGLFVGVEYHKRFDRRNLIARREYALGRFGQFVLGEAKLIEPYLYRRSNFQNWFTAGETDPFVYVGCHYVDLVFFITGLKPTAVSVAGVRRNFPNGNEGFLWTAARVRYENGALLAVTNGLGYPDDAAGSNDQGLLMYCEGEGRTGLIRHDDQYRGVSYCYQEGIGLGGSRFNFVNPDFFKLVPWEGPGARPVGYGVDSVTEIIRTIQRLEEETAGLEGEQVLSRRREFIRKVDEQGIIATPANSYINELVIEAARQSILQDGRTMEIVYGANPGVKLA